jgi:glycosyltransferase involved in cell wall biosynthesis
MRQTIAIKWGISSFFAWGLFGLNLALQWVRDRDVEPLCASPMDPASLAIDPLRCHLLAPFFDLSARFTGQIEPMRDVECTAHMPMLLAFNGDFANPPNAQGVRLSGHPSVGVVVFETARLRADAVARAAALPVIVAASEWNRQVMVAHGLCDVVTVLQGVDPSLFHPAPASGLFGDRFCIFSGGKLEYRKGQDIVLAAFARFSARHADALLITAWQSPWPQVAVSLDRSGLAAPVPPVSGGKIDIAQWVSASDVDASRVIDLGTIPNAQMAMVLREMDVAVFPNRCEGGTNQVAMECMACGVPVVLSANTGHLDLIDDDVCFALTRQDSLAGDEAGFADVPGWGESSVDELVECLERVFADRAGARARGRQAARRLTDLSWAHTAVGIKQVVLSRC